MEVSWTVRTDIAPRLMDVFAPLAGCGSIRKRTAELLHICKFENNIMRIFINISYMLHVYTNYDKKCQRSTIAAEIEKDLQ